MTGRRTAVGTRALEWASRHLDTEAVDTFVLPVVADLQHEHRLAGGCRPVVRWSVCVRGYVALGKVLGLQLLHGRLAAAKRRREAVPAGALASPAGSGKMSQSTSNPLLMVGAGVLVAAVGFAAGRLSAPEAPRWQPPDEPAATWTAGADSTRAIQRSIDDQRRETAEGERKLQQQLDQQRYDADMANARAERARIDAETELASQQTQQVFEQRRQAAELENAKLESARRDAYLDLARQRTQQMLEELNRKR